MGFAKKKSWILQTLAQHTCDGQHLDGLAPTQVMAPLEYRFGAAFIAAKCPFRATLCEGVDGLIFKHA